MSEVLVVANRTLGGRPLLDHVSELATTEPGLRLRIVVPQSKPSSGLVIYDEAVRDAAQIRVDLAVQFLRGRGMQAVGEVGDPDPFYATMDALAEHRPQRIVISTHPSPSSGWLRRDLLERVEAASGLPVDHVTVDLAADGFPFKSTLVIANRTSDGDELVEHLRAKADHEGPHLFVLVMPQEHGEGHAAPAARARLQRVLEKLRARGLTLAGMIGDPDPYTAAMNALEFFSVDDVVISTLPAERSGWLRSNLIERVQLRSRVPVEHVVVHDEAAAAAAR